MTTNQLKTSELSEFKNKLETMQKNNLLLKLNQPKPKIDITYIIGHRSADELRKRNLFITLGWLLNLKEKCIQENIFLNIVVIEQDVEMTIKDQISDKISYIFIYNSGFYNRGWGFNVGFRKYIQSDYFYFADNDIIMKDEDMIYIFKKGMSYDAINPYKSIYNSDNTMFEDTNNIEKYKKDGSIRILQKKGVVNKKERPQICFSGGIVGLSRKSMYLISGWDERFRGRGWEDYAFTSKLYLFIKKLHTFQFNALHLYHEEEINTTRNINFPLSIEYSNYTVNDYISLINSTSSSFGNWNKYSIHEGEIFEDYIVVHLSDFLKSIGHANNVFNKLKKLVEYKHPKNKKDTNIIQQIVYNNLINLHNCHKHRINDYTTPNNCCCNCEYDCKCEL